VLILLFKKGKEISLDWNTVVEDTGIRLRLGERRGRLLKDINGMPVNVFYEIFLQQEKGKGFLNHTFISPSYESVYRKIVYDALFMDEEGLHFAKSVDRVKEMNVGMVSKALHQYLIEKIGPFFESIDQRFMVLYCAGRLASLGEASKKEIEKYKRAIGFLSYGEVVTYNRKALFLNWSCVYLFFESSIHLPPVEPDTTPLELTRRFTELGQILTDLFMKDMVMAVVDMNENLIFYNKMLSFLFDSEEDIKDYLVRWSKSAKEKKKTTSRIHHLQSKSKNFYFRVYSIPYRDFIILTIEDFTKYASLEILERNLRINPITGLPTRHSIQYENKASCFTLDIQNFGSISLYYSEDIANQLLTEVSSILSDYAHSFNLMLYHTGIDEFTLISKDLGPEELYLKASIIMKALSSIKYTSMGINVQFKGAISYGTPKDAIKFNNYAIKTYGGNLLLFTEEAMNSVLNENFELIKIVNAVNKGNIKVLLQPIYDKRKKLTTYEVFGRVFEVDEELKIHWRAFKGVDAYKRFTEMVVERVLENSFKLRGKKLHFNLSKENLSDTYHIERLINFFKKLTQEGIKASIELVEWSEYSHELKDVIRYLKKNGVSVGIDDFGVGYYDLSSLGELDIDYIKLDKSFLEKGLKNSRLSFLIENLIKYARAEKIYTVAEGVEDKRMFEFCLRLGVDYFQGFLLGGLEEL